MKKERLRLWALSIIIMAMVFGFLGIAKASLIDMEDGTIKQIKDDPIYGDGSELMWVKDANLAKTLGYDADAYMTWDQANSFIDFLNTNNYAGYNNWRLPNTSPLNGVSYNYSLTYNGSTDVSGNIRIPGNEISYLYYVELGNVCFYNPDGSGNPEWSSVDVGPFLTPAEVGPFDNLDANIYWTSVEITTNPSQVFYFNVFNGMQGIGWKDHLNFTWAVRDVVSTNPDSDGDGIPDENDNCQFDANPDQADFDGDGIGDVCDNDMDNDGVIGFDDQCPETASGEVVNSTGCSIADQCPCDISWKNHGAYVSCVARTSEDFVAAGLITEIDKDIIVSTAAKSDCGNKK